MIGIISYNIHSNHMNYGAALHSYAFQQYLKKIGAESIVIDYYPKNMESYNIKYPFLNNKRFWHVRSFVRFQLDWGLGLIANLVKYRKFGEFFDKYLNKTDKTYTYRELMSVDNIEGIPFDTFVCESDVIWKLYGKGDFDDVFFLNIPSASGKRKVAYSPSLGSRKFDKEEELRFKSLTNDFTAISTRESQGAQYVSELLGRKVPWVLDPTFLLTDEDYSKIAVKPKDSHYLLIYNCMVNDIQMVLEAKRLGKKLGLNVIEISNFFSNKIRFDHKVKTNVGIEEFLGYFKYADFIVCNAFHGCCFANIFMKQFYLFQRDESDFRMKNITDALGEEHCFISCKSKTIPDNNENIDYKKVYKQLTMLKQNSIQFINEQICSDSPSNFVHMGGVNSFYLFSNNKMSA